MARPSHRIVMVNRNDTSQKFEVAAGWPSEHVASSVTMRFDKAKNKIIGLKVQLEDGSIVEGSSDDFYFNLYQNDPAPADDF